MSATSASVSRTLGSLTHLGSSSVRYLMEYSVNIESVGASQCTTTVLLVTFSMLRFFGGCGTEKQFDRSSMNKFSFSALNI